PAALSFALAGALTCACPAAASPVAAAPPFTIDALLRQEGLGGVRISPDGRWIALEQLAAYDTASTYRVSMDTDRLLSSVRIFDARTGEIAHVLDAPDGAAGYTLGRFSPDGRRLAVYRLSPEAWRLGIVCLETGSIHWTDLVPEDPRLGLT